MKFGPVPTGEAEGAVLAHSVRLPARGGGGAGGAGAGGATGGEGGAGGRLPKGRVLSRDDLEGLRAAGIAQVVVARLEPGDVGENEAAAALAHALAPEPAAAGLRLTVAHSGRVNLKAAGPGVLLVDAAKVREINGIDPGLTLATLAPFARVSKGLLAGTVKVIPYAVSGAALERACAAAAGAMRLAPVVARSAVLVLSEVAGQKPGLTGKGRAAIAGRLEALGIELARVEVVTHEVDAMARALQAVEADLALILTGSATSDSHDTAPEALRAAGGRVSRFGMPVDPGNLLFLGALKGGAPVIGLPGCARSPALNGADWVLERVACGIVPGAEDFAAMGVGGLLKEIPIRPHPRERRG